MDVVVVGGRPIT